MLFSSIFMKIAIASTVVTIMMIDGEMNRDTEWPLEGKHTLSLRLSVHAHLVHGLRFPQRNQNDLFGSLPLYPHLFEW